MIEITHNLFIGSQSDYENVVKYENGWYVIHACKEPYHRQALGYSGRALSKDHPEYLMAERENRLILNLVDVADPAYISKIIIDKAIGCIAGHIHEMKVLVHCNQGASRSATIGLLYLHYTGEINTDDFEQAEAQYSALYPLYMPANGMRLFAKSHWEDYGCMQ